MCFIERETQNFILKFREIFPTEEQCSGPTEWNLIQSHFLSNLAIFKEKNGTCWDWQVFFFISEGLWRIFLTLAITDSPFNKI